MAIEINMSYMSYIANGNWNEIFQEAFLHTYRNLLYKIIMVRLGQQVYLPTIHITSFSLIVD